MNSKPSKDSFVASLAEFRRRQVTEENRIERQLHEDTTSLPDADERSRFERARQALAAFSEEFYRKVVARILWLQKRDQRGADPDER